MEEVDKDWMTIRMVGGWMFLVVPAHQGSPGQRAIKRLLLLHCSCVVVLMQFYSNKVTNLRHLTAHSTTCCPTALRSVPTTVAYLGGLALGPHLKSSTKLLTQEFTNLYSTVTFIRSTWVNYTACELLDSRCPISTGLEAKPLNFVSV